jgi:cytochrome c biogenesis DsbD-like protein
MRPRTLAVAGICVLLLAGAANPQAGAQSRTFVSFVPTNTVVVAPGRNAPVEFTFHVESGYHVNSDRPTTEELIPTQLHFSLPGEIAVGKVQYPAGQLVSFPFDPTQKLSVYSGDFVIRAVVIAPANAAPGTYTVHGELKYQACDNNACYPPKKLPIQFDAKIEKKGHTPRSKEHVLH